ncbi:MAG: hypothetical protein DIZ80_06955 [endosymbiont of Galathealinum brachiosum]|uniref:Lipoprotein n=1 Tax=endosymbiont of Galathealinum brachiosum TaxID=2200906 RepID=A0A370DHR9_9GAMM|nr:MAG: hypothetical protein DIZ80_06955 [endosymbiont of Galathealinum brachiosum]
MKTTVNTNKNNVLGFFAALFIGFLSLQGCSSSGGGTPSENANGLFTGTGSVNNGTTLTDIRGFVNDNAFIFFDETEAVLYQGTITSVSGSSLTATLDVYLNGAKITASSVSATGTVTGESSLALDMTGTGFASGSLTLLFDPLYNRGATMARLAADSFARWVGSAHTPTSTDIHIVRILSEDDEAIFAFRGDTGTPSNCRYEGVKSIPDAEKNIYLITSIDITDPGTNNCDHIGTGYTGFFAVVDGTSTDDTVLFAATNGTNSNFSIMTKPL